MVVDGGGSRAAVAIVLILTLVTEDGLIGMVTFRLYKTQTGSQHSSVSQSPGWIPVFP